MELKEFLEKQEKLDQFIFMKNLDNFKDLSDNDLDKHLLVCKILAAITELGEYANELQGDGFKYWKKKPKADKQKRLEEFVDVWHFMFSIANHEGFTAEDIEDAYNRKYEINIQRQREGY